MIVALIIVGWFGMGISAYWLMKRFFVKEFIESLGREQAWTKKMARGTMLISLTGPLFFLTMVIFLSIIRFTEPK